METIDIILLSNAKNQTLRNVTEDGLKSLFESEDSKEIRFQVLVFESADVPAYDFPNCQTIFPKEAFGYNKYMNMGLKMTHSRYVCLCNNDLIFHRHWAAEMVKAFQNNPQLSSASPYCSRNHPLRGIKEETGVHFGYEVRKEIAGWCLFFKREILEITGPLEERLKFWYSDNDYSRTLEKNGLLHGLVSSAKVDHLESLTLRSESKRKQLMLTGDERYFYEYKWGDRSFWSYLNHKRKQFFKSLNAPQ